MKEFKYKGAVVRPYEPFHEHYSERFFSGSMGGVSPSICAFKHDLIVIIENEETDITQRNNQ